MGLMVHARRWEHDVTILKRLAQVLVAILILAAVVYPFRRDPIGPLAGKRLTGEVASETPADWSFSDAHMTIAVEVRPDDPHSITTICFVHEGTLYVPAQGGSEKEWTQMVLADPRVRLKIGERIYPARATRITDESQREAMIASAAGKYERLAAAQAGENPPEDVWVFRIDPR
jgi:hypothetical protein